MESPEDTLLPDDLTDDARQPDELDWLLGTVLADRYRLDRIVGRGGWGTVYEGTQLELDRTVAVKVLHPDMMRSNHELERFRREAFMMARLRHTNIVTVHDFGVTADRYAYIVMEYLPGTPLNTWLEGRGPVPPNDVVWVLDPVCRAIDASHAAGVIHRDLKPSNIILPESRTGSDVVKVVDFGIARLRETEEGDDDPSGDVLVGTPAYMSPELVAGKPVDGRADIYALGIIAYEMLTERAPYDDLTWEAVLMARLFRTPSPPSAFVPGLSRAADAVILKALEREPETRYQTASEFVEDLESAIALVGSRGGLAGTGQLRRTESGIYPREGSGKPSILLVDDDPDVRALIQRYLEKFGYEVTIGADGVDALLHLGSQHFDLILSDVDMPNLDGFALLELKSKKGIDTPVIFLTAYTEDEKEMRGFELGAEDYIKKPIAVGVLLARVKRVLAKSRLG